MINHEIRARTLMIRKPTFIPLSILTLFLASAPAGAGPLRLLASGGPESAFGIITFSESDIDLQRPADLLSLSRGRFAFNREYESIIKQKKGDRMLNLGAARKQRIEFAYPFNESDKYRSAFGGNLYSSNMKFLTTEKLGETALYDKGAGGAAAFAQQFGRFSLGVFRNTSGNNGIGSSSDINNWVYLLSDDAEIFTSLGARREGFQAKADISKRISAGFLEEKDDIRGRISFADAEDNFSIPATLGGGRRELSLTYGPSSRYDFNAFFNHGGFDNLGRDSITYNSAAKIGFWFSKGEYDSKSFVLTKRSSENKIMNFGYEDYSGYYWLLGEIKPINIINLLNPAYPFNSHGYLNRHTYKYSLRKKKGNYTYRFMYAYSQGDAFMHFRSLRRVFFSYTEMSNERMYYDYTQHQLGLGIEKTIRKNTLFRYSLLQTVPLLEKREEQTVSPGGPSAAPSEKKKTRGGTLHLFSVIFLL